jgi:hypothetical protein
MTHNAVDRQLILEVVARYAFGNDEAKFEMIGEAFAKDATSKGVWSTGGVAWGPMRGRDEIVAILSAMRQSQPDQPRHIITNFLFTKQTDSSASARFYLALNSTTGDKCSIVSAGKCDADFVNDAGIWRLSRLDALLDRSH